MTGRLAGKTVIVTGGGRGYGMHMSQAAAGEGASVVVTSRTLEESKGVARSILDEGGTAIAIRADVTDEAQVQTMVEATLSRYGQVDILINDAGHPGSAEDFVTLSAEDWRIPFDVNLMGSVFCAKAVLPGMIERRAGHIVNVSSATARIGHRFFRSIPYTVSKYAIEGLSFTMAVKLEPLGVRVNAFVPGLAHTRFLDDMPPGFLSGIRCQTTNHVIGPILHLLCEPVPTGESLEALKWLEERGLLDQYSYVHD